MFEDQPGENGYQAALIMNPLRVDGTTPLLAVVQAMGQARLTEGDASGDMGRSSCVLVVDGEEQLQGIITERDLVRLALEQGDWQTAIAGDVMTKPVWALKEDQVMDIFTILEQFRRYHIRHLPILSTTGHLKGLITQDSLRLITRPIDLMRFQTVADVMTAGVITVGPDTPLMAVNQTLVDYRISCVVVAQPHPTRKGDQQALGILTERDLVQLRSLPLDFSQYPAHQAMSYPLFSVGVEETLWEVQMVMETHHIHQVVVTGDQGELRGIITQTNVLSALNPWELFRLTESLEKRVSQLEAEKTALLADRAQDLAQLEQARALAQRNRELEKRVAERTQRLESTLQALQGEIQRCTSMENAQERLVAELRDLQYALDQTAIVAMTDREGRIMDCNDKLCEISGYRREELIGQTHRIINSRYHPPDFFRNLWQTIRQGQLWKGEICNRAKDGRLYWVNTTIVPLCDDLGKPVRYLAIRIDITAQKEAEQALQRSEANYRRIVETANEGIWVLDAQGSTTFVNPAMAALLQRPVGAMVGQSFMEFIEPSYRAVAAQLLADRRLGLADNHEFCFQRADGSPLWTRITASPIVEGGKFTGCLGMVTDITAQKQAQAIMDQQLACIEAAIDGIAILQNDQYIYVNHSHLTLFGYDDPAEFMGKSWRFLYTPEEQARFETDIFPQLLAHHQWQGEAIANRRDGSTFAEELSLTLIAEDVLICVCRDISARKESERILRQTTTQLDHFFSLALDLLCIATLDGRFLRLNQQWERTLDYSLAEIQTMSIQDLVHPDDWTATIQAFERLRLGTDILGFINRYRRRDGDYRWIEWRSVCKDGIIYAAARDVTDRKTYEDQLRQTNQELERATRLKDEFLANMSHELRTPLNAILGMTDGLKEAVFGPITDRQSKALKTIYTSGEHLLTLINDILDLSKIEAGKITLDCQPTAVAHLCRISLDFVKQLAHQKSIALHLHIPDRPLEVSLDERRIRQVLINLLSNAVKFTPKGGRVDLQVSVQEGVPREKDRDGSPDPCYEIHWMVKDTGIGIRAQDLDLLFQPFVQVDSAYNRQYEGTGLGLALAKRIVELHGGHMVVNSVPGQGSEFGFILPMDECAVLPPSVGQFLTASAPATSPSAPARVLLVEDNEANIQTFTSYLEAKHYQVITLRDGGAAIREFAQLQPDIILMDIQLPEVDGMTAIAQIRAHPEGKTVPIIALTALAMKGDREQCLAAGADEYLSKPVKLQHLAKTVQTLLSPPSQP